MGNHTECLFDHSGHLSCSCFYIPFKENESMQNGKFNRIGNRDYNDTGVSDLLLDHVKYAIKRSRRKI